MEPALIGTRLASAAIGPLLRKLLVGDGPGAGLTASSGTIRLSSLVSFRGEKRSLTERDVRKLAATLVERSLGGGERPFPADETEAVTDTLARTLLALGDLDMDDVQAVRLGHRDLARRLRAAAPPPDGLSTDSALYLESLTEWAALHLLEFFTQRSTFVARSLVEQTRAQAELIAKVDEVIRRTPRTDSRDADFERRYLAHLAKKHGRLTIYGIDLHHSPDEWPLDLAYLSLEATGEAPAPDVPDEAGHLLPHQREQTVRADLALARHDKVLLRGLAGSGKTTLVQWLAVSASTEGRADGMAYLRGRVPFVLPLRALTRHGERLPAPDRFLPAAGCPLTPPDGWADRVLAAGRAVVLVDGIDEIPEAERGRARDWLRNLLDAYEGNRWLVTSRPTAVRDDWLARDGFTELTLSPMTRTEVATFVRRWHRAAGPEAEPYEQPLLDALRTTGHVAQLATNPLMCGLICALHRDRRGFLPRGRKALYEAALSMLLSRRDRERDMGAPSGIALDEAPQIQLVQRLAYWLTLNGRTQLDRARAESLVREAVPAVQEAAPHDPGRVFTHLLHRSGLLREPTEDTVDFVHRTFQDYLAAKALVDHWDIGVLVRHAADDQWEDVIRMAVGHARPRECAEILRELLAAADSAEDRRDQLRILMVAATALESATEVSPEVRDEIMARTAELIPPRSDDEARQLALGGSPVLRLLGGPEELGEEQAYHSVIAATHIMVDAALPYLARFADHPSLRIRAQLMHAWTRFEPGPYAEEVIARLDPGELRYFVHGDEHVDALIRLGLRPDLLEVDESVSDEGLARLLAACDPVALRLRRPGRRPRLSALSGLTRLESLVLGLRVDARWSAADLPTGAPLGLLQLPGSWPEDGLETLGRLRSLTSLNLWKAPYASADAWRGLATLSTVRALWIDEGDLVGCPEGMAVESVRTVRLTHEEEPELSRIGEIFPSLDELELTRAGSDGEQVRRALAP
ncbi:NACHT domain-containing NTPase [Streptomyces sp. TLI_105]|uniref:NACHT domain-containing protein n=1 Tax=Streptomyces sp. TLI_105 TaxID=1881019 RepID=UPI00089D864C|nr:NACHT domain-containing protein [Streptomyces sp. TLI_105]SED11907.1 NACHT domain-containing protein [Streptomyces sp. TLI_105]